jgi:hypothetical protein
MASPFFEESGPRRLSTAPADWRDANETLGWADISAHASRRFRLTQLRGIPVVPLTMLGGALAAAAIVLFAVSQFTFQPPPPPPPPDPNMLANQARQNYQREVAKVLSGHLPADSGWVDKVLADRATKYRKWPSGWAYQGMECAVAARNCQHLWTSLSPAATLDAFTRRTGIDDANISVDGTTIRAQAAFQADWDQWTSWAALVDLPAQSRLSRAAVDTLINLRLRSYGMDWTISHVNPVKVLVPAPDGLPTNYLTGSIEVKGQTETALRQTLAGLSSLGMRATALSMKFNDEWRLELKYVAR